MSFHCLMAVMAPGEKYAAILFLVSLCKMCLLSLAALKLALYQVFSENLHIMYLFVVFFLMVLLLRTHWTSWTCGFLVFISWKLFQALWFQMLFLCPCISPTFFGIFSSVYSFLIVSVAMPSKSLIFFSSVSNLLSNW